MLETSTQPTDSRLRIGMIGAGHIGSALAKLWARAGHPVFISSRHPEKLDALVNELGRDSRVVTPVEAAQYGTIVVLSIPFGEMTKLEDKVIAGLQNKIVIDTCNPYPDRDGRAAVLAQEFAEGSECWLEQYLPHVHLVKAFNTVPSRILEENYAQNATRDIGVPIASNFGDAFDVACELVRDAGLVPVIVGGLERVKDFDVGTTPYGSLASAEKLLEMLPGARIEQYKNLNMRAS